MKQSSIENCSHVDIMNVKFKMIDESACVQWIMQCIANRQGGWVITFNMEILRRYTVDSRFRQLARAATLIVADGMPLIWASTLQGSPLPERVAGSNLISTLSAAAAINGKSVFLLGGDPGTADGAAAVLQARCPGLRVAGTFSPPIGFENDANRMLAIRNAIRLAQPDIVYVALGSPKQEWLIAEVREGFPEAWWLGIGISFSFLAGTINRAPPWLQQAGLEWAHRLVQEPRRLAKRYLLHGIPFALLVLSVSSMVGLRAALRCCCRRMGARARHD